PFPTRRSSDLGALPAMAAHAPGKLSHRRQRTPDRRRLRPHPPGPDVGTLREWRGPAAGRQPRAGRAHAATASRGIRLAGTARLCPGTGDEYAGTRDIRTHHQRPLMRRIGDTFEQRACTHLAQAGLALVARNYSTRFGELDLVMRDGETLVFVEVRYRRDTRFGGAAASVTRRKRERLIRAATGFIGAHAQYAHCACR